MRGGLLTVALVGIATAGLGTAGCTKGSTGVVGPGSGTTTPAAVSGLVSAQYPVCADRGNALAHYLDTGQPTSDDPAYGDERQQVLGLAGERRALYIRQQADALIEQCDSQQAQAAAAAQAQAEAQAQAQAQAAQQAAAQAQADAEIRAATPACEAVGGRVIFDGGSLECSGVHYIGTDGATYIGSAPMSTSNGQFSGPLATGGIGATQQECTSGYYPDLSTGPGYGPKGTWNAQLAACLPA